MEIELDLEASGNTGVEGCFPSWVVLEVEASSDIGGVKDLSILVEGSVDSILASGLGNNLSYYWATIGLGCVGLEEEALVEAASLVPGITLDESVRGRTLSIDWLSVTLIWWVASIAELVVFEGTDGTWGAGGLGTNTGGFTGLLGFPGFPAPPPMFPL